MAKYLSIVLLSLIGSAACGQPTAKATQTEVLKTRLINFDAGDLKLEGTFEAPEGKGPFPALLLLPGSGPTDRDGNSSLGIQTNVLKEIADHLAKNGIASFRYDKRAIAHYSTSWPKTPAELNKFFSWDHFVGDAKSGLKLLASQPEVDPKRLGLLGHSEGALISLQMATDSNPKVVVLLGSTGRPMGIILHEQIARLLNKQGVKGDAAKPFLDYTDAACTALAARKPLPPNCPPGLAALFNPTVLDIVGAYCRIDPTDLAKRYAGPVLAINGENDTQVSAVRDTPRLMEALKSRSKGVAESYIAPETSHNLKSTKGATDDAFTGPIVPGILDRITKFVKAHI